ncbi:MAG: FAD-dependent oxidoreductase [Micrococcaceae bacterium]
MTTPLTESDVVVVGGGVSGVNAALGAALTGASVTLIEKSGFLGGTATGGMVAAFNGCYWNDTLVTGGTARLILDRLEHHGGGAGFKDYTAGKLTSSPLTFKVYPFDPEILKISLDELLLEHGIQVILHAHGLCFSTDDQHSFVTFLGPTGTHTVKAKQVIDASSEAIIAESAGATIEDSPVDQRQPMTCMMRVAGVDIDVYGATSRDRRREIVSRGVESGDFFYRTVAHSESPANGDTFLLVTAVHGLDGRDPLGISVAERHGREQALTSLKYLIKNMPGFENASLVQLAPWIGQRESVRVRGVDRLTAEDVATGADHPEAISYGGGPIDRHEGDSVHLVPPARPFAVPRGVLIPRDVSNMCVTGRTVGVESGAMDGLRHMGGIMPLGHAAGVISALAASSGAQPADVPYDSIRATLIDQGAILSV